MLSGKLLIENYSILNVNKNSFPGPLIIKSLEKCAPEKITSNNI